MSTYNQSDSYDVTGQYSKKEYTKGIPDSLIEYSKSKNIAEELDDDELRHISYRVTDGLKKDTKSMQDWLDQADEIMDLMSQKREEKIFPWRGAANIKFPMITNSTIQFAARAFPDMFKNGNLCDYKIIGKDDGDPSRGLTADYKKRKGIRNRTYLNWLFSENMPYYLEDLDQSLHMLSCVGTVHMKTWYDPIYGAIRSQPIPYDQLIVDMSITNLEDAPRVSQYLYLSKDKVMENIRFGYFCDHELEHLVMDLTDVEAVDYEFVEQHCTFDLCNIGLDQPYVVTQHVASGKIFRIAARFDENDIETNDDGDVAKIHSQKYFTKIVFMPSADGTYFGQGFGTLLYDLNKTANTTGNMLINAGYLATTQGGLLGKGLKIRKEDLEVIPGQWKHASASDGSAIKDNVFPFDYKPPSRELLELLQYIIHQGELLTSTSEVMSGQGETQNVSPSTIAQMISQGLKTYTAVGRRISRAKKKEIHKVIEIVAKHIDPEQYCRLLGIYPLIPGPVDPQTGQSQMVPNPEFKELFDHDGTFIDFDMSDPSFTVVPVVDLNEASQQERLIKADAIKQLVQIFGPLGAVEPRAAFQYCIEALDIEHPERMIGPPPQPQPNPQLMKVQVDAQQGQAEVQLKQQELQLKAQETGAKVQELQAKTHKLISDADATHGKVQLDVIKTKFNDDYEKSKLAMEKHKTDVNLNIATMQTAADIHKHQKDTTLKSEENAIKRSQNKDSTLKSDASKSKGRHLPSADAVLKEAKRRGWKHKNG